MPPFMAFGQPFQRWLIERTLTREEEERIDRAVTQLNSAGYDDWGLNLSAVKAAYGALKPLYTDYFRVETTGIERVPQGRVLLIANHGGQIPIDGMLVGMAMLREAEPPRIVRGMVERWVPTLPFVSTFMSRVGQVVGDVKNCIDLLSRDQCVLVFPEGVRGSGKTIFERYQLKGFGTGFVHMALETGAPIVPVAVIGCEEIYPSIANLKPLARALGAPYIPLPLSGLVPLPTKVTIRFGEPIRFGQKGDQSEAEIEQMVAKVRKSLHHEIKIGLVKRGEQIFTGSAK